jgi:hypothetical protein
VTALWGIYGGETLASTDPHGTAFRAWCAQNGFPQPPLDDQVRYNELMFLDKDSRQRAVAAFQDFARANDTLSVRDPDLAGPRQDLQRRLAQVLEPEEVKQFGLE